MSITRLTKILKWRKKAMHDGKSTRKKVGRIWYRQREIWVTGGKMRRE